MKRNLKDVKLTWNAPMIISNPTHKLTPIYIIDSYENRARLKKFKLNIL